MWLCCLLEGLVVVKARGLAYLSAFNDVRVLRSTFGWNELCLEPDMCVNFFDGRLEGRVENLDLVKRVLLVPGLRFVLIGIATTTTAVVAHLMLIATCICAYVLLVEWSWQTAKDPNLFTLLLNLTFKHAPHLYIVFGLLLH